MIVASCAKFYDQKEAHHRHLHRKVFWRKSYGRLGTANFQRHLHCHVRGRHAVHVARSSYGSTIPRQHVYLFRQYPVRLLQSMRNGFGHRAREVCRA